MHTYTYAYTCTHAYTYIYIALLDLARRDLLNDRLGVGVEQQPARVLLLLDQRSGCDEHGGFSQLAALHWHLFTGQRGF